jgi:hypothetical protein
VGASFGAYLGEVPFVREMTSVERALTPSGQGHAAAEFVKQMAVPQLVQWVARELDKPHPFQPGEQPRHRPPHGFQETLEAGVPGLRQKVPVKN